jgi:hypothetical protein
MYCPESLYPTPRPEDTLRSATVKDLNATSASLRHAVVVTGEAPDFLPALLY